MAISSPTYHPALMCVCGRRGERGEEGEFFWSFLYV